MESVMSHEAGSIVKHTVAEMQIARFNPLRARRSIGVRARGSVLEVSTPP